MTNIADGVPSISSFRTITGTLEVALKSLTQKLGFEPLHHRQIYKNEPPHYFTLIITLTKQLLPKNGVQLYKASQYILNTISLKKAFSSIFIN